MKEVYRTRMILMRQISHQLNPRLSAESVSSVFYLMDFIKFALPKQKGRVAEWLGRGLQNLVLRFKSARDLNHGADSRKDRRFSLL